MQASSVLPMALFLGRGLPRPVGNLSIFSPWRYQATYLVVSKLSGMSYFRSVVRFFLVGSRECVLIFLKVLHYIRIIKNDEL